MSSFSIMYHHEPIAVKPVDAGATETYHLQYKDGRWLLIEKRPDDSKTVATFNDNISYSTSFVWTIAEKSEGPDWVNTEQLQVIAELISVKRNALHETVHAA
ncbi:MAG: hypothetical protein QM726_26350 [Chitinophagaceae bacterium]